MKNIALIACLSISLGACNFFHSSEQAIVDCTKQDMPKLQALESTLLGLLAGNPLNWDTVVSQAEAAGVEIGGCAIADMVNTLLSSKKAMSVGDSNAANNALKKIRAKNNGASFRFGKGDL